MRPELNKVPAPTSDSAAAPVFRSTNARTRPPAKIGAVVAIGRYEPTANDKDRMPHSSSVTETNWSMPAATWSLSVYVGWHGCSSH